jgi:hypothetical protein
MHSVPVPINVRCYSNSDIIARRSEVTLGPITTFCTAEKQPAISLGKWHRRRKMAIHIRARGECDRASYTIPHSIQC